MSVSAARCPHGADWQVKTIRARCDLKDGDIVTVDRVAATAGYLIRSYELKEHLDLFCDCYMCRYDKYEDYMAKFEHMRDWEDMQTYLYHEGVHFDDDGNEMTRADAWDMKEAMFDEFTRKLLALFDPERPSESVWLEFQTVASSAMTFVALSEDIAKIEVGSGRSTVCGSIAHSSFSRLSWCSPARSWRTRLTEIGRA